MPMAAIDFGYFPRPAFADYCDWPGGKGISYTEAPTKIEYHHESGDEVGAVADLNGWFNETADKWERETAIHSSPGATYLHKAYMLVIAKGVECPETVIPLILSRIAAHSGDWFFALESIAGENPAAESADYESALMAWRKWAQEHGFS